MPSPDNTAQRPQTEIAETADDPSIAKHVPRGKPNLTDAVPTDVAKIPPVGGLNGTTEGVKGKGDDDNKGSLRIHIELDLDVELHLTARVKGDITIGLL